MRGTYRDARRLRLLVLPLGAALLAAFPISASAQRGGGGGGSIFGSTPIPISVGPSGEPGDGPSGGASVSGDDRKGRRTAFHSLATNLVAGDSNGASDIFVWSRPGGSAGLTLEQAARPAGSLVRASVSGSEGQANGSSINPSMSGSITSGPRCVAFQSTARNLSGDDGDATSDIFVRDLDSRRTFLVSRGIGPAASNPSIDGACRNVAFQARGRIYVAGVKSGRPDAISGGSNPSFSLDGRALVWQAGGSIRLRREGRTTRIAGGRNPTVSDRTGAGTGVVYDSGGDVFLKTLSRRGLGRAQRVTAAGRCPAGGSKASGGSTAYVPERGIVVFSVGGSNLCYFNKNSGNADAIARANAPITETSTSARANFVAFTSTATNFPFDGNGPVADVFFKHLVDGAAL